MQNSKTEIRVFVCFQAIEYVFKFIVKSRLLYDSLMGKGKNEFQEEMRSLFIELVSLMEDEKNETLLIQVFHGFQLHNSFLLNSVQSSCTENLIKTSLSLLFVVQCFTQASLIFVVFVVYSKGCFIKVFPCIIC